MSHHFDTPTGREDPRLNLSDLYLFEGGPDRTVMAMTVNPEASASMPAPFRQEGIFAFRFDTDDDAREDVSFLVRFGDAMRRNTQPLHAQPFEVQRSTGGNANQGQVIASGLTNEVPVESDSVRAFAGVAQDVFAGDGTALESYEQAFAAGRFTPDAFTNRANLFQGRHIGVIVLDVPTRLIGDGEAHSQVHAWATLSLEGHAPTVQVARWGLPLVTHLFIRDADMREDFNRSMPSDDNSRFTEHIAEVVRETTKLAGTTADPGAYAQRVVDAFGSITLPYQLGTPASFDFAGFNGRALTDDVMDVMLTLTTNTPLGDGVEPDPALTSSDFPYFKVALDVSD